jgi:hypothetical protein
MTKLLGFQKKFTILLVSFLLSSVHRANAGGDSISLNSHRFSVPTRNTSQSLALWFGRGASGSNGAGPARQYILEFSRFFPWLRLSNAVVNTVPVSILPMSLVAESAVPELRNLTVATAFAPESCPPPSPPPPSCQPPACPGSPPPGAQ